MTRLPTVKQLRYLVALDEHGHFGRAAAACFVSQSAFSIAVRELEALLGVRVVDRTRKRVTMTDLGRELASQARLCLRDIEMLADTAAGRRDPLTGPLTLGVIPTIAPFLLPRLLPTVRRKYPRLQLYLREDVTRALNEQLLSGKLDALLVALPYPLREVEVMKLFRDRFLLAAREGTALVDPEHYRFNRLQGESVLLLEDGHCLRDHALSACRVRNLQKVSRFSASSLATLVQMVDNDLGITFLPEIAVQAGLLRGTRVRAWPLSEGSYREVGLVWRRGSARGAEFRELGRLIRARHAARDG